MFGVTISDFSENRVLSVSLKDILDVLDPAAESFEWEISGVEAVDGAAADELHQLSDRNAKVPGHVLVSLASEIMQVIDGVFRGYRSGESEPWIVIRAVDSSAFDVLSKSEDLMERLRQRFKSVVSLPDESA